MMLDSISYRTQIKESDLQPMHEVLRSTEFFYADEIDIALELAKESLLKGEEKSGYRFILAEMGGLPLAFATYGKIPGTKDSFDLYWIAVNDKYRREGIGKTLLIKVEKEVVALSGRHLWIETSSRSLYNPTRKFYLKMGYRIAAELPDFYAINDNKIIFVKHV